MMKSLAVLTILLGCTLRSAADYTVTTDLLVLPVGPTNIVGTTTGGPDNSIFFQLNPQPDGNWGHEVVYRFELTQRSTLRVEVNSITAGDPDFFLMSGLGTSLDVPSGKEAADEVIDFAYLDPPNVNFTFITLDPGVYYLAIENWDGIDGAVMVGDATFDITLQVAPAMYELGPDLGNLSPGAPISVPLTLTNGNPDRIQYHPGVTGSDGNWGAEVVYQFTLVQPSIVTIDVTQALGNPDWILLDSLSGTVQGNRKVGADGALEIAPLDGGTGDSADLAPLPPGTYYLAVEDFDGTDTVPVTGDAAFAFTLSAVEITDPMDLTINLGILAVDGVPLNFDTFGSAMNTEMAIFDASGTLLAENDDSVSTGGPDSEIDIPAGLPVGTYTLLLSGFDTTFSSPFGYTAGGEVGDWVLNFPLGFNIPDGVVEGTTSNSSPVLEIQFFTFEIIAPPFPVIDDLGVIAEEGQSVALDTMGSLFDTQLLLYDPAGFFWDPNGDFFGGGQPFWDDFDPVNFTILTSGLSYTSVGLPAGKWYAAIQGWAGDNQFFGSNFLLVPGATAEGGEFTFNAVGAIKTEVRTGFLTPSFVQWIAFEIAPAGSTTPPEIVLESVAYNPVGSFLTVTWGWNGTIGSTFRIESSTDGMTFTPVAGLEGLTGTTATFVVAPAGDPTVLYQVVEE